MRGRPAMISDRVPSPAPARWNGRRFCRHPRGEAGPLYCAGGMDEGGRSAVLRGDAGGARGHDEAVPTLVWQWRESAPARFA